MKQLETFRVQVARVETLAPRIKRFTLIRLDGSPLPPFSGGSHIVVSMSADGHCYSNAYSLMSSPMDLSCYQISVREEEASRGGSRFMHECVKVGDELNIAPPANLFPLAPDARKHVLVAGGIGITPFLAQLHELQAAGADYELHYAYRSRSQAAFIDELIAAQPKGRLFLYSSAESRRIDISSLLRQQPAGTHVYVCGPHSLNEAVKQAAEGAGWSHDRFHQEQFHVDTQGSGAFTVVLAQSGKELTVGPDETILQVMEKAGVSVPCLCREGVCGTCETAILDGEAEHRDQYLSEEEQASQKTMMICVSRAKGNKLVLDL